MKVTVITIDDTGTLISNVATEVANGVSLVDMISEYEESLKTMIGSFGASAEESDAKTSVEPVVVPTVDEGKVEDEDEDGEVEVEIEDTESDADSDVQTDVEPDAESDADSDEETQDVAELVDIEEVDVVIKRLNQDTPVKIAITNDGENYLYVDDLLIQDNIIKFRFGETIYRVMAAGSEPLLTFTVVIDGADHVIKFNVIETGDEEGEYGASISRLSLT